MSLSKLTVRLAKLTDATQLAEIHLECLADLPGGVLKTFGKRFRYVYYRLMLNEPHSLVLCLEDPYGRIFGLAAGSLDTTEHLATLRGHRIRLLRAALPALIGSPRLVAQLRDKQEASQTVGGDNGYVVASGPRLEFWGVVSEGRTGGAALTLLQAWLSIAKTLGANQVRFEVNETEREVEKVHRLMGATIVKDFSTRAGVKRKILEYKF